MDSEEKFVKALHERLLWLERHAINFQAAEIAMMQLFADLEPHVGPEIKAIFLKYWDYKREARMDALLALEKKHPGVAAEIDNLPDDKSPLPPQPC